MRLVKRTAHIYALDQGRDASCQECLLQAVMAHSRLLKHGGYTPLQLLFGHEPAPIEGETLTESMAERLARQQSAMKAWLQAEAEFRVERAQNRRTGTFLHWPSGTRVCYWRADVPSVGCLPTIRHRSTVLLNKQKGAWLGPATVLAQEKGRSQEQHEEAHGTVWIVVQGRLMRCAPEYLPHLSERESLSYDRDKGVEERARTLTDIVQDFKFSKGTHIDRRSQSDLPEGSEPRHLSGRIFLRTPTETSGTSSSGANTETILVVELPIVSSDTKMEEPMPVTPDTPETDRRSRYRDPCSRATSRCATCSSSTVDSTQNLRKTWICSGTPKKRQTSHGVAGRR